MKITFLSALFLTGLGSLLSYYGIQLEPYEDDHSSSLQFSGALIAAIFWVLIC